MTTEQLKRERDYRVANLIAKSMLDKGIISKQEYKKIDTKIQQKYGAVFGNL